MGGSTSDTVLSVSGSVSSPVTEGDVPPVRLAGRLENWSLGFYPSSKENPYLSPQQRVRVLCGRVYGNPEYADGHPIRTNYVVAARGRLVTTFSGSVYELGEVDPHYRAWSQEQGFGWDEENPVRIVTAEE
jgi:hypothetical protein